MLARSVALKATRLPGESRDRQSGPSVFCLRAKTAEGSISCVCKLCPQARLPLDQTTPHNATANQTCNMTCPPAGRSLRFSAAQPALGNIRKKYMHGAMWHSARSPGLSKHLLKICHSLQQDVSLIMQELLRFSGQTPVLRPVLAFARALVLAQPTGRQTPRHVAWVPA